MKKLSLYKYKLLSHFPGRVGHRYRGKLTTRKTESAMLQFEQAVKLMEGKTCLDLGANIGNYTRKMALVAEKVIAFEPDPWTRSMLEVSVSDLTNVQIECAAVGTEDGTAQLFRIETWKEDPVRCSEGSTIVSGNACIDENKAIEVRLVNFIRYLEELDEDIGIIKIDIEGSEVELLEALFDRADLLRRIDFVFAETHETMFSNQEQQVNELRRKAMNIDRPRINLDWH
ncbi:MAG: FkbM family methyltransferase [Albidovulum sp.]|nr:FkbM family methyltransferase [Albidovulum sp.]